MYSESIQYNEKMTIVSDNINRYINVPFSTICCNEQIQH